MLYRKHLLVKYGYFFISQLYRHNSQTSWRVLFFGNDSFSLESLVAIHNNLGPDKRIIDLEVVSSFKEHTNPVRKFSVLNGLKCHSWPLKPIQHSVFDIGVVVSFGYLIPERIINLFPLGMINVHASLLPRWRGAAPIIHAIMNGDTYTGITIMKLQPHKFDVGEIVMQRSCEIGQDELMPSLYKRLSQIGAKCLVETLFSLPDCLDKAKTQPESQITYAPKINKSWAVVKWEDCSASQIYNLYRALYGFYSLKTYWHGVTVKLQDLSLPTLRKLENFRKDLGNESDKLLTALNLGESKYSGTVLFDRSNLSLLILCKDNAFVSCSSLMVNGKTMKAFDFYNGYMSKKQYKEWKFRSSPDS